MDVFDAIKTLLAVREYAEQSVPEDVVRRILDAGRLTGGLSWACISRSNRCLSWTFPATDEARKATGSF